MKKPQEIIDQLSLHDAIAVLKTLADSDAQLAERIAENSYGAVDGDRP